MAVDQFKWYDGGREMLPLFYTFTGHIYERPVRDVYTCICIEITPTKLERLAGRLFTMFKEDR